MKLSHARWSGIAMLFAAAGFIQAAPVSVLAQAPSAITPAPSAPSVQPAQPSTTAPTPDQPDTNPPIASAPTPPRPTDSVLPGTHNLLARLAPQPWEQTME